MGRTVISRLVGTAVLLAIACPAYAFQLITAEDASRKPGPILDPRGNIPGPTIDVKSPMGQAELHSPVTFEVTFKSFAGSKIDVGLIRIIYVKDPPIDLTKRVKDRLGPKGFEPSGFKFEDGEVVPGTHTIRIEVGDTDGRKRATYTTFTVGRSPE